MDRDLRIRMLLQLGDKVTKPLRDMAAGSSRAAQALKATRDRLAEIKRAQANIAGFRELKTGLRSTEMELHATQTRVADLARQMAAADTPTKKLAAEFAKAKREASALKDSFEGQSAKLQQMRDRLAAAGISTSSLVGHERRLREEAARTNAELGEQERKLTMLAARSKRFSAARETFGKMQGTATGLAAGGAASIGTGIAAGTPLVAIAKDAMNLEDVMADVRKVVNFDTPKQFEQMREQVIALSTVLPRTAQEIGTIVAAGGRSGLKRGELLGFATDATKMSVAFDMSAEEAGTMMATWRTAFGVGRAGVTELGDKVNALTNAFGGNVLTVNGIVTRIGPLGKVAGVASGQIAGLAQMMAKLGLEEDVGATGIKNMMLALSRGAATTPHAAAAFKELGLDATQTAKRMQKDAGGTILDVFHRLAKLDASVRPGVMTRLFGRESIAAIAPLLTALPQLEANFALVGDKTKYAGSMEAEYQSRARTTSNAVQLANNNMHALFITVGTMLLPTIVALARRTGSVFEGMRRWASAHPFLAKGLVLVTGVMAALMVVLGGSAIVIAGLVAPFAALATVATFFGIGMLPLIGIVAAVVVGIMALVAAGYAIYANWGAISAFFAGLWSKVTATFRSAISFVGNLLSGFSPLALLAGPFGLLLAWLGGFLPGRMGEIGRNLIAGLIYGITGMLSALKSTIVNAATSAANWFKAKLGIHSPSRVFMAFGGHMMAGLSNGIDAGQDGPVRRLDGLSRRLTAAMAVGAAMAPLAMPSPAGATAARSGATAGRDAGSGDRYEFHLHAAPGMDEAKLIELLRQKLEEIERQKAARARSSFADTPDWGESA